MYFLFYRSYVVYLILHCTKQKQSDVFALLLLLPVGNIFKLVNITQIYTYYPKFMSLLLIF